MIMIHVAKTTNCKNPGCTNPRAPGQRICTVCRNRQRGKAAQRQRQRERDHTGFFGCNTNCSNWQSCNAGRLWAKPEPLPCENLLDDEIGYEYEAADGLAVWVMPLTVTVRVEAI